jgi:polysaccharide deacetylase family protein (PEP-CTERM system associated)
MLNALTIDVEEYFHPSELVSTVPTERWTEMPRRVEASTQRVLDLLAEGNIKGTFFVLGWVAEHYPHLVRAIHDAGHEIGCHSYAHQLVYDLTPASFKKDTMRAVNAIADACGVVPRSYRAPSYSITKRSLWALEVLAECGFQYDSSIYPISHDRYGMLGYARHAQMIETASGSLLEVPIATIKLSERNVTPIGGGGYLRLLPYAYTAAGIRELNREGQPACVYFHPWEIDPEQPRLSVGLVARLRTYTGLSTMESKIRRLTEEFRFGTLSEVFPLERVATVAQPKPVEFSTVSLGSLMS